MKIITALALLATLSGCATHKEWFEQNPWALQQMSPAPATRANTTCIGGNGLVSCTTTYR